LGQLGVSAVFRFVPHNPLLLDRNSFTHLPYGTFARFPFRRDGTRGVGATPDRGFSFFVPSLFSFRLSRTLLFVFSTALLARVKTSSEEPEKKQIPEFAQESSDRIRAVVKKVAAQGLVRHVNNNVLDDRVQNLHHATVLKVFSKEWAVDADCLPTDEEFVIWSKAS
jgi:hypothetical protein